MEANQIAEYTWQEIENMCKTLSEKIEGKPNCIIALARGGLPIAGLLADMIDVSEVYSIGIKSYEGNQRGLLDQ